MPLTQAGGTESGGTQAGRLAVLQLCPRRGEDHSGVRAGGTGVPGGACSARAGGGLVCTGREPWARGRGRHQARRAQGTSGRWSRERIGSCLHSRNIDLCDVGPVGVGMSPQAQEQVAAIVQVRARGTPRRRPQRKWSQPGPDTLAPARAGRARPGPSRVQGMVLRCFPRPP